MSSGRLGRALEHGFIDQRVHAPARLAPQLISNQAQTTMSRALSMELRDANSFVFSVAFITPAALMVLKQDLLDFQGPGLILTSNYLGFNTPATYRELLNLPGIDVRVLPDSAGFHAKGYLFRRAAHTTAIIGSSNLTVSALSANHEWNLRFSAAHEGHIISQLEQALRAQMQMAEPVDTCWIDRFEDRYRNSRAAVSGTVFSGHQASSRKVTAALPAPLTKPSREEVAPAVITPNTLQTAALASLARLREASTERALVISATGTGKTMMAALDARQFQPGRLLFLAHREQILDSAREEFRHVLGGPASRFGKLAGGSGYTGPRVQYLFATVFSFLNAIRSNQIDPHEFDYVVIDEVHRAGAASYREILDFLKPEFLLGMTATPDRMDGFNVFGLFDYNLAYEIRLQEALEAGMVAPFHYFGVTDFTTEAGETITEHSELRHLAAAERVDHLVRKLEQYGQAGVLPCGLIFCSRNAEAAELSRLLNERTLRGKPLRTRAISGSDPVEVREAAVQLLEEGSLDYLLSVDVFNEGIDIPALNQIVMLRQTQSSVVFTQQLGRGLRKHENKDYVVVIDFIGNYANNYLIPTALFGDTSLDKDSVRRRMIDVQGDHVIAGVSSINFDRISRERVFQALRATKLDSMAALRNAFRALQGRLGRSPMVHDFAQHDTVDPVLLATRFGNYAAFLQRMKDSWEPELSKGEHEILTLLSTELLNGKRPQELLFLRELICAHGVMAARDFQEVLRSHRLDDGDHVLECIRRIFSLEWFTEAEQNKYGAAGLVHFDGTCFHFTDRWRSAWASAHFRRLAEDVIDTGLHLATHRHGWSDRLMTGHRYTRKDVCRLLNWQRNEQSTIYGYKVDRDSNTCPIFVTYHKADDVSASTRYGDAFLDQQRMLWYTRSRRTLESPEVAAILSGRYALHLFVKKDDVEGTDFIYLGPVRPSNPEQTSMPDSKGVHLPVVTMHLELEQPIDSATFDYFVDPGLG